MSYSPAGVYVPDHWAVGAHDARFVERPGATQPTTNTAWIANLAVYVPFVINQAATVYEWWWVNGSLTTAHNVDFGIYREDFTKVQSLGSTVGGTTASTMIATTTWTDLVLEAGRYYMAFADDSTRGISCSTDAVGFYQAAGLMEQTSAFALPSPAVPVEYTRAFCPSFGFTMRPEAVA